MRTKLTAITFSILCVATAGWAQLSDQEIVDNAFPASLDQGDGLRYSRFIVADLNRNGQPLLIAAYTNRVDGAIRVLNRAGQVLAAPNVPGMRGFGATLQATDLDADGIPEIIVEFDRGRGQYNPDAWVFRWTGPGLQLISPTCAVGSLKLTCLGHLSLIDLKGDGRLSLLSWPSTRLNGVTGTVSTPGGWKLYVLSNGMFQASGEVFLFAREFHRREGDPFTSTRRFAASPGAAILRVINGTGPEASTSGHVSLNGVEVLTPQDFKRNQHVYDVPVTLTGQNTLTVRLDGKPGSKITILVKAPAPLARTEGARGRSRKALVQLGHEHGTSIRQGRDHRCACPS